MADTDLPAVEIEGDAPDSDRRDLDEFSDDEVAHAPTSVTERRRAQKAIFENWLISDAAQEALKPKTKEQHLIDANDEELSIQSLMTKQGAQIIKNPRQYQLELFERAQKQNTIAVLDTGSGKTLIAVLLLRWTIDQELERRAAGNAPRIAFFLVASITLVFQQFAVLETNIDHKVARVCGADKAHNWDKAKWVKLSAENKVIVATADVLHQCLAHSYITMKQINLLIFDEAHHAKKNHAYARIIKDFYLTETDDLNRPRVFGMTASPIDAKADVVQAANELESLLHCHIATTDDMSLTEAIKKPSEQVLKYATLLQKVSDTALLKSIKARFPDLGMFERQFEAVPEIARHLGRWCADLYLVDALSERKMRRYELQLQKRYYYGPSQAGQKVSQLDDKLATLRDVIEFVEKAQSQHVAIRPGDFSSKVTELQRYLGYQFERPSSHRCIVFVEARQTAKLLAAAFKSIGTQHMRCGFLIGANTSEIDEDNFTFRAQVMTLMKFRKGDINCLFATSVAEEGLDVPDCNLVIRFDIYKTMIQYVQSRGRARKSNSRFIHMVEIGNSIHSQLLSEVRFQEAAMRRFCQALPEDRRLTANEDHLEDLMAKEKTLRVYTEPSTGAKLTYGNSLVYLANFASAIPTETEEAMHPTYVVSSKAGKFTAEVMLPGNSPVRSAIGLVCTKKTLAKRSAAFEACVELRRKKYLDEHLMPVYQKKLPAMRNALLAVNMKKTNQYTMRTKPSIWAQSRGALPTELWVTMIDFPDGLQHPHQPFAMLTRTPLPHLPSFSVYLDDGRASTVVSTPLSTPLQLGDGDMLAKLTAFTFRVFKDVFSKTYEEQPDKLSYWLAPLARVAMDGTGGDVHALGAQGQPGMLLDWPLLEAVHSQEEYRWTPETPAQSLVGRFLVDKWDGSRKFFSTAICEDLKPQDPVPEDAAKAKWNANILDYSISLFKNARERAVWNQEQPVMVAEKLLQRRNLLASPDTKETNLRKKAWLCPEPLIISVLPPAVAEACFVWPAVIHRLESYLIAMEACSMVGVDCEPAVALAAMTKDSDNSGDHEQQERINFQSGMGDNYERLEFIGDTFLKTATSISTFIQNPNDNEFEFHVKRMLMLCNQNLFNVALNLKLYEFIRSIAFSRRLWYPEGLKLLQGKGVGKQEETSVIKHPLGEKTIADVCEALIGAAFLSHDRPGEAWQPSHWEPAVRAVTKLVQSPDHTMMQWSDYNAAYAKPAYQTGEVSASQRDLAEKVELEHPYHFNYPALLRSAFIHPSQPLMYEKVPNYQRLEFLGDALLDQASISHLFHRFPDKDPQWLTEHKMAMVSNKFLGAVSVNIGFHKHLRHSSAIIQHQVGEYANELLEAKRVAGDARDYWTTVSDPPKCLPDIVESFVGAMFIDSDFDYNVVQRFFEMHVMWYFEDMSIYDTFANNHPCTHLHTLLQTTYGCQDYRLMARELPSIDSTERKDVVAAVMIHNEIVAHSKGKSGRYARLRVAHDALKAIEGLAPFEFRGRFGCNCQLKVDMEGSESIRAKALPADCNI
ncbi:hypothetical protein LTR36_009157 [Oleoguttula mirabilis]|uniref:Dicer-like protein 1 n=1 Tax=Oleoguttula mirabilis TaxID=1507867 RepID=A0AAV9J686_9PEZI|nr:hypothetical protein LTR36_009157 [Oleoguttula mirabilis]